MRSISLIVNYTVHDSMCMGDYISMSLFKDTYLECLIAKAVARNGYQDLLNGIFYNLNPIRNVILDNSDVMLDYTIKNEVDCEHVDFESSSEILKFLEDIVHKYMVMYHINKSTVLSISSTIINKTNLLITADFLPA